HGQVGHRSHGPPQWAGGQLRFERGPPVSQSVGAQPNSCQGGYGGGVLVTGPTWTRTGSRHPDEASSTGTRLPGSVTLTRSNGRHRPAGPETSPQSLTKYIGCPGSTTIRVGG